MTRTKTGGKYLRLTALIAGVSLLGATIGATLGAAAGSAAPERPFPMLRGPYLGQAPPGELPQPFGWGIICTEEMESGVVFSLDGRELFFTRRTAWGGSDDRILTMKEVQGTWSKPAVAPFAQACPESALCIAPNGERVFFSSSRPKPEGTKGTKRRGSFWAVERTDVGWGQPHYLGAGVNDNAPASLTALADGTVYFMGVNKSGSGLFRSVPLRGVYKTAESLAAPAGLLRAGHPFMAPDETYLLFDASEGGSDSAQSRRSLWVSFRQGDGSWGEAKKLPEAINATGTETTPSVSPDGKYLFFARAVNRNLDLYWINARVVEKLREPAAGKSAAPTR